MRCALSAKSSLSAAQSDKHQTSRQHALNRSRRLEATQAICPRHRPACSAASRCFNEHGSVIYVQSTTMINGIDLDLLSHLRSGPETPGRCCSPTTQPQSSMHATLLSAPTLQRRAPLALRLLRPATAAGNCCCRSTEHGRLLCRRPRWSTASTLTF